MAYAFDPSEYEDVTPLLEIPDGEHEFLVVEGGIKTWDDGGKSANFKLVSTTLDNKWLFASFNIEGNDPERAKKARSNLAGFCKSCGQDKPLADLEYPSEVLNKTVIGTVQTYQGKKGLVPWGFHKVGSTTTPVAPATGIRPHEDDLIPF